MFLKVKRVNRCALRPHPLPKCLLNPGRTICLRGDTIYLGREEKEWLTGRDGARWGEVGMGQRRYGKGVCKGKDKA